MKPDRPRGTVRVMLLILHCPSFLTISFSSQRLLYSASFAWLKVKGVPLKFLDHVFLLDFSFKAANGIFKRFSLLKHDFCQI